MALVSACDGDQAHDLVVSQDYSSSGAKTYSVLVGAEDTPSGAELEAYFPSELHIHPGDTVTWQQNASEIHTVTFLPHGPLPELLIPAPVETQSSLMFNPQVALPARPASGDFMPGSYINSGLMGREQGDAPAFRLTFPKPGRYAYYCAVHGDVHPMGVIVVEDAAARVPTPEEVKQEAREEVQGMLAQVPDVLQAAQAASLPASSNPDGTQTHHVRVGFSSGSIDLRAFFPDKLTAHPGDRVEWALDERDPTPHSIAFLNGQGVPQLVKLDLQPGSRPLLLVNPDVVEPMHADQPLTLDGMVSSGLLWRSAQRPSTFSIQVGSTTGQFPYVDLAHSQANMQGTIEVVLGR